MKRVFIAMLLISVIFAGCKKDEKQTDTRDQFVGNYNSTLTIQVPAIGWDDTFSRTYAFAKSSEAGKLTVTDDQGGNMTAVVTGNVFAYEKETVTITNGGVTTTIEITGGGTISGNTITESGAYNVIFAGQTYPGTWTCTHTRK